MFEILPEKKKYRIVGPPKFWIRCIPTGTGSGSVMLLIQTEGKI